MALTADRDTKERPNRLFVLPLAATTKIFAGSLVCTNAAGNAVPGSVSTTLKAAGRAEEQVDNSAGAIGDKSVTIKRGTFLFKNSASGDLITKADRTLDCYIVDDETVAKTNGGSTRSIAGKVMEVTTAGVWVQIG